MPETAGTVYGAEQGHENTHGPDTVESVGMGRQPAHGMECHRVAGYGFMLIAPAVCPLDGQFYFLVPGGYAHLVRQAFDHVCRNTCNILCPLRGIFIQAIFQQLESGFNSGAVIQFELAQQIGVTARRVGTHGHFQVPVPPQLVFGIETTFLYVHLHPLEQTMIFAVGIIDDQFRRVGVLHQEFPVVQTLLDQFMANCQQQCAVRAGFDGYPLIRDSRIARTYRVNGYEPAPTALELRQGDFHRIGMMIFSRANHHEQLGPVQIGATELPEGTANAVYHASRHVHRTEAAVG